MQITTKDAAGAAKLYSNLRVAGSRAEYISTDHNDLIKDMVIVSATAPKRSKVSYGARRSSVNFVQSCTVAGLAGDTQTLDAKVELVTSFPVGMSDAAKAEVLANAAGFFLDAAQVQSILTIGKIA